MNQAIGMSHAQEIPNFLVVPSTCYEAHLQNLEISFAPETVVLQCRNPVLRLTTYIAMGPDLSWPIIPTDEGLRSLEEEMYSAVPSFGSSLLFFDREAGNVWVVDRDEQAPAFIFGFLGNDPNTLVRRSGFVTISKDLPLMIFDTFGQALDFIY